MIVSRYRSDVILYETSQGVSLQVSSSPDRSEMRRQHSPHAPKACSAPGVNLPARHQIANSSPEPFQNVSIKDKVQEVHNIYAA